MAKKTTGKKAGKATGKKTTKRTAKKHQEDYDNTNRGAMFKNEDREGNQPHYRGKIDVEGTEYWVSGWLQKPKKGGSKYLSLSINPVEEQDPDDEDDDDDDNSGIDDDDPPF